MSTTPGWTARLVVECATPEAADRLSRTLSPEAEREVPRARAVLERPAVREVAVRVEARDTGALRAALQTYLGWFQLTEDVEAIADVTG